MREFFQSWRRKAGLVTLMMACVVSGLWVRSIFVWDIVSIHYGDTLQELYCEEGAVLWATCRCDQGHTGWSQGCKQELNYEFRLLRTKSDLLFNIRELPDARYLIVYYWQPLLPLILFSTYLILSNPRKRK